MRTLSAKESDIYCKWYVVDATDQPVGRLASRVATVLRGKHRPNYTPHADVGDFVIIVNADKVRLTGNKADKSVFGRTLRRSRARPLGHREQPPLGARCRHERLRPQPQG